MAIIHEGLEKDIKKLLVIIVPWLPEAQATELLLPVACKYSWSTSECAEGAPEFFPQIHLVFMGHHRATRVCLPAGWLLWFRIVLWNCVAGPPYYLHVAWPLPPKALAHRPVAEFPFGHNKQGSSGERRAHLFLFPGVLKYGMEYWWAAVHENLWKKQEQRRRGRC